MMKRREFITLLTVPIVFVTVADPVGGLRYTSVFG
jgi:hypothetical protein